MGPVFASCEIMAGCGYKPTEHGLRSIEKDISISPGRWRTFRESITRQNEKRGIRTIPVSGSVFRGGAEHRPRGLSWPVPSGVVGWLFWRIHHNLCRGSSPSGNSRTSIGSSQSQLSTYNVAFSHFGSIPELTKGSRNFVVGRQVT